MSYFCKYIPLGPYVIHLTPANHLRLAEFLHSNEFMGGAVTADADLPKGALADEFEGLKIGNAEALALETSVVTLTALIVVYNGPTFCLG